MAYKVLNYPGQSNVILSDGSFLPSGLVLSPPSGNFSLPIFSLTTVATGTGS